jgi:hypothetical protein
MIAEDKDKDKEDKIRSERFGWNLEDIEFVEPPKKPKDKPKSTTPENANRR